MFIYFFFQYIVEKHAKTLLPQYLGVYRITVDNKETYLLVMKSVFSTKFKIHKKYDLKGSTVDRQASSKEKVRVSANVLQNNANYNYCRPVSSVGRERDDCARGLWFESQTRPTLRALK